MHRRLLCIFIFTSLLSIVQAQDVFKLGGTVDHKNLPTADVHVINKTFEKYTITNQEGAFSLLARVGDTIVFSAVQYKLESVVLQSKESISITLIERINELDEVVLYNKFSGDPAMDMKNSEVKKPINFYDIGIPGYTGSRLTKPERKLYAVTSGSGLIPFAPIINAISGRTKMLKKRIGLERKFANIDKMQERYEQLFIDVYKLPKDKGYIFFDFCADDKKFEEISNASLPLAQLDFLIDKFKEYEKSVLEVDE